MVGWKDKPFVLVYGDRRDWPRARPLPFPKLSENPHIPVLGFDIVETIAKFMDDSDDVTTFMRVCRVFHRIGSPILFRWRVSLEDMVQLRSFHAFIFSPLQDRSRLLRFLKKLYINISHLTAEHARLLSAVIIQATHLQELMFTEFNAFLKLDPRDAIPSMLALVNLKALCISEVEDEGTQFLKTANYALTALRVHMKKSYEPHALTDVLQFAPTLTSWELMWGISHFEPTDVIFPRLHTLRLRFINDYIPCDEIFRPFPNLKVLVLPGFDDRSIEELEGGHEESMEYLAGLDRPVPRLESLSGDPRIIYHSALYCPADELVLDVTCEERCRIIPEIIRASHPSIIRMDVDISDNPLKYLGPLFIQMDNLTTLKELQLRMLLYDEWKEGDQKVMSAFPAALEPLRIESLSVQFQFPACKEGSTEDWDSFEKVFDQEEWVVDVATEVSTLHQVVFYSTWNRWIFNIDGDGYVVEAEKDSITRWPFCQM